MALETTRAFKFSVVGDRTGDTFGGDFVQKLFLTDADEFARDARYRELLGTANPAHATQEVVTRAWILADLFVRLTKAPPFWTEAAGLNLLDRNVAKALYDECKKAEDAAVAKLVKKGEEAEKELRTNLPKE